MIKLFFLFFAGLLFFMGCYACPPPISDCKQSAVFPDRDLEVRITRHFSLRPKRMFFVKKDSLGNYIQEGEDIHYFKNGQPSMKELFINGLRQGTTELWYYNGHKKADIPYNQGKIDGVVISWHKTGKIASKKTWQQGALHGQEVHYDNNGKITKEIFWQNNKIQPKGN